VPDDQEKTEQPTSHKLAEARKQGNVARSQDLSAAVILLGTLLLLMFIGGHVSGQLQHLMKRELADAVRVEDYSAEGIVAGAGEHLVLIVQVAGPIIGGILILSLAATLLQTGLLFTTKPLTPSLNKISPLRGLKRLFSRKNLVKLAISIGKIAILGSVAAWTVADDIAKLLVLPHLDKPMEVTTMVARVLELILDLGLKIGAVLLVLAIIDFIYQKWQRTVDLKMSKQEVKDELRRMEGDPLIRSRRRRVQMQVAIQRMKKDVPGADVVVTNPTELAVALKYDAATMSAPRVVAKGAGYVAKRIREIAIEAGVPIVERKPLAQALFRGCEVGDEVPPQLYRAVAEILAYVYELSGRHPARTA